MYLNCVFNATQKYSMFSSNIDKCDVVTRFVLLTGFLDGKGLVSLANTSVSEGNTPARDLISLTTGFIS